MGDNREVLLIPLPAQQQSRRACQYVEAVSTRHVVARSPCWLLSHALGVRLARDTCVCPSYLPIDLVYV